MYNYPLLNSVADEVEVRQFDGEASGPIFLDQVHCSGTESRLSDCDTTEVHMCDHDDDVGIICHRENYTLTIVLSIYKKPIVSQKRENIL